MDCTPETHFVLFFGVINPFNVKPMENHAIILEYMEKAGAPVSPGQIAEATGLDRKVVDKAIKQLKEADRVESPRRCYYAVSAK